jgi:hypothetical protein
MKYRKRCAICGQLTPNWEKYNGILRCYPCGREAREASHPELFRPKSKTAFVSLIDDGGVLGADWQAIDENGNVVCRSFSKRKTINIAKEMGYEIKR